MTRNRVALVFVLSLIVTGSSFTGPAAAKPKQLTYSIKQARAYAVKASLTKEVIEAVPKCNPDEDPYACTGYSHKRNCPPKVEIGHKGNAPAPRPPKNVRPLSGGAGKRRGLKQPPPQSTPVRINRFLSLAKLSNLFNVEEAGGLSSQLYTDGSGRSEPLAHTESEGYSSNKAAYEERCYWNDDSDDKEETYEHYMSRSGKSPNTYHLAECVGRQCNMGAGVNAERAQSILQLTEENGFVSGSLRSSVEGLSVGDGTMTIDSIVSFVKFKTDGTADGLHWSVSSTAAGAKLAGQPVEMPPGDDITGPGYSVGMARPFVDAPGSGRELTIVAPGLHFGSDQQSAFFGGAELYMSMSREEPFIFEGIDDPPAGESEQPADPPSDPGSAPVFEPGTPAESTEPAEVDVGAPKEGETKAPVVMAPVAASDDGTMSIFEQATGIGAVATILALGGLGCLLLMSRWSQQFSWGRRMMRRQPFRLMDWMYRAFVKT